MATKRKAYRNTRTGGIRQSSTPLGYPYEPATTTSTDDAGTTEKPTKAGGESKG